MKKSSDWVIFFGLLAVPAAIYYSILLLNWYTDRAELNALVKTENVVLPLAHHEYFQALDSPSGRKQVRAAYEAAAKDKSYYPPDLDVMRKFTESVPIFAWRDTDVITVKIANVGRKAANNVKVFFPSKGFAEITKDDAALDSAEYKGWIELGTLEPASRFVVTFWTDRLSIFDIQSIRINSDGGAANLKEWYVSRDKNRWVIGFGPTEMFLYGGFALIVLALLGILILGVISWRLNNKPTHNKPTESH